MTALQVACLMRVLSKPEFDDCVRYSELEVLLENFGAPRMLEPMTEIDETAYGSQDEDLNIIEDDSSSSDNNADIVFIDDTRKPEQDPKPSAQEPKKETTPQLSTI